MCINGYYLIPFKFKGKQEGNDMKAASQVGLTKNLKVFQTFQQFLAILQEI